MRLAAVTARGSTMLLSEPLHRLGPDIYGDDLVGKSFSAGRIVADIDPARAVIIPGGDMMRRGFV